MSEKYTSSYVPLKIQEPSCILWKIFPEVEMKKKKCCKNWKKEKRCKKCPED